MLHVVLVEPEIPPNTGNIARLCLAAGASLHLVEPLEFSLDEKALRRAGMDYWHLCDVKRWGSLEDLQVAESTRRFFLFHDQGFQGVLDRDLPGWRFFSFRQGVSWVA
jgi:tRNA (cytidine/uridine-2'-O-)-methyltransferase